MNIGEAARRTKLPAKTIRYYEDIGLVVPARRANGYRDYADADVHRLIFMQRARTLGFTIDQCRGLLSLYSDKERASSDVKKMVQERLTEIDRKVEELNSMRHTLAKLADNCRGDARPDCPILDDLAGGEGSPASS